jgi:simple sugar transport system permease protein
MRTPSERTVREWFGKSIFQRFRHLIMPLMIMALLLIVNFILDFILKAHNPDAISFFRIGLTENNVGNTVLDGEIIRVLNAASELVIIAIGMTLVTAASKGQDISVGAIAAIGGSVFVQVLRFAPQATWLWILIAFLASALVAMLFGAFNGTLVAKFGIQPMIATLILFTSGRSIAYAINGNASPILQDNLTMQIGSFIEGIPIQTPIFIVVALLVLAFLALRFTNLRLYFEAVGANEKSARLNGLNPARIKLLAFVILGFCCALAGFISTCRMQRIDHNAILGGIEMYAILAVAIGGNALAGGRFFLTGAIIGAYTIELLKRTLLRMQVAPEALSAYMAIFIVLLMIASSPVLKQYLGTWFGALTKHRDSTAMEVT